MSLPSVGSHGAPLHTNRLALETSPYLLQHAHNPVDWYPWGSEAWERARAEDKPVLISIGYAACHWCHVMERESFENEAIAQRQNDLVISIKVDREERPDVDEIYMEAVQLLRQQGGWPLNVFCLPDGRPFYGGTYFPPAPRMGMPSWTDVLEAVMEAYRERREAVQEQAGRLLKQVAQPPDAESARPLPPPGQSVAMAAATLKQSYDVEFGGFGGAPKFPQPFNLGLLLHYAVTQNNTEARDHVLTTLRRMGEGGIYDQLGGGFHRYSVDARWLVPHFEKMLYDNALLPPLYLDAARITGDPFFRRIAEETLDYLVRELRAPEGAFYASTDADSEGEEGKYFVWSQDDVRALLDPSDAAVFARYYNVSESGNFEGHNILNVRSSVEEVAQAHQMSAAAVGAALARSRDILHAARAPRVPPPTDIKVITAWNGLAIDALAKGGAILNRPAFTDAAIGAATFILKTLRAEGRLIRIYAGGRASVPAFLDDYAAFADGLISLYETTGDERWFREAQELVAEMLDGYWDSTRGGFFTVGAQNEPLVARNKPLQDGATPSGNSMAARAMARLYALTSDGALADRLEQMAVAAGAYLTRAPTVMTQFVVVRDWLQRHQTVAVVGAADATATQQLLRSVWDGPPRCAIVMTRPPGAETAVPQMEGKEPINGVPTAYVCHGFQCSAPVTDADALAALLAAGPSV